MRNKDYGIQDINYEEFYVNNPIYIWNYENDANRPLKHQINGVKAPAYIMDAFSYSFSKDVIKQLNGKKRMSEKQWYFLFEEWWDEGGL